MQLATRQLQSEQMDDPTLDRTAHRRALAGLRRINAWSGTAGYLGRAITRIATERGLTRPSVLDVACGGGDLAIQLSRQLHGSGIDAVVHGCDISSTAVEHATANAAAKRAIGCAFFQHDALREPLTSDYDIITTTLFLHHLREADAVAVLGSLKAAARHALLVDDLIRSRRGYWLAQLGCRVLSRSPIVHYDGPASVQGAYTLREVSDLAAEAGLEGVTLHRHWPERFLLTYTKAA